MSTSLDRAKEIVGRINYLTISTVDAEGNPWNAPVFGICDNEFNCYWGSYQGTQHSKNVEQNGKVYIVIYDSTVPAGTGEGVYVRGVAAKIEDTSEIDRLYSLMNSRHNNEYWPREDMSEDGPIRFYKATAQHVWMNDEGEVDGVYVDTRKQLA